MKKLSNEDSLCRLRAMIEPDNRRGICRRMTDPVVFSVGDTVRVTCSDEGYNGKLGKIVAVFPSGRCQVSVGDIAILNLPPEGMRHVQS